MHKYITKSFLYFLFFLTIHESFATGIDTLFIYNKSALAQTLTPLDEIDRQIEENGIQYAVALQEFNITELGNLSPSTVFDDRDRGVPPFVWGCCLGPVGVVFVLAAHEQQGDMGKALLGCMVPSALFTLGIYLNDPFLIQLAIEIFVEIWKDM